jgi:hypothetical protein
MLQKVLITCYYITSLIQERNLKLWPETEKRLHQICPTVSAHIVNGENVIDGAVETLLNFLDGSPRYNCVQWSEEDKYLREIGLQCDQIETPDEFF